MQQQQLQPIRITLPLISVDQALEGMCDLPFFTCLDSSLQMEGTGRYTYLMADPYISFRCDQPDAGSLHACLQAIEAHMEAVRYPIDSGGPSFRGGVAGYWAYEAGMVLEGIPILSEDAWQLPLIWMHGFDVVIAIDHQEGACTLYSSGMPEMEESQRVIRAQKRAVFFQEIWEQAASRQSVETHTHSDIQWHADVDKAAYMERIERTRKLIYEGDIFQANIALRFSANRIEKPASEIYRRLRKINAAPFSAFLRYDDLSILCSSPERFIQLEPDGSIESRPIKGTRPRSTDPDSDTALARELINSEKDRAENAMIVDLIRNDLSKISRPGTVEVPTFCGLESYASVHHLVSVIRSRLREGAGPFDLMRAAFPGGSITGAPKHRSLEIIAEQEGVRRNVYCGSIGYWGWDGRMDMNIAIRTAMMMKGEGCFFSGGGITWQSDASDEYEEVMTKADKLFQAFL